MVESSQNWLKTLWEKEKLLVTSNFSFFPSVFKRLVQQTHKNKGLFGEGFMCITMAIASIHALLEFLFTNTHGGESRDTTTTTMTHIWKNPPTSGKKIFNNSVNTWPIGIWFEAEKAERLRGFAWCVRFFKQHLIKKLLTSKQIIQGKKFVCSSITFLSGVV